MKETVVKLLNVLWPDGGKSLKEPSENKRPKEDRKEVSSDPPSSLKDA
jgi:hypothetical protein